MDFKNNIFSADKVFTSSTTNDWINLPSLNFYKNLSHAILVCDNNNEFFNTNFKNIIGQRNSNLFFNEQLDNGKIKFRTNKKEILEKIELVDTNKLNDIATIPLIFVRNQINQEIKSTFYDLAKINKLLASRRNELINFVHDTYKILMPILSSLSIDYLRQITLLHSEIGKKLMNKNIEDFISKVHELRESRRNYFVEIINKIDEYILPILKVFKNAYTGKYTNNTIKLENEIETLKNKLHYYEKMAKVNSYNYERTLELRDVQLEVKAITNQIKNFKSSTNSFIKYLISWYQNACRIDFSEAKLFSNTSVQHNFLMKRSLVYKYMARKIFAVRKSFFFTKYDDFLLMRSSIASQVALFLENNLSTKKLLTSAQIKKIIKNEMVIDFTSYADYSNEKYRTYLNILDERKNKEKLLKRKFGISTTIDNFNFTIRKLQTQFDNKVAELDISQNKFKKLADAKTKKNPLINNYFATFNENNKMIEEISNLVSINISDFLSINHISDIHWKMLNELSQKFQSTTRQAKMVLDMFSTVEDLWNISVRSKASIKEIKKIETLKKTYEVLNHSSVTYADSVKNFNIISPVNKLKIFFLFKAIEYPKIIFLIDNENEKDFNVKYTFLNSAIALAKEFNITLVFVTKDHHIIQSCKLDYTYACFNNKIFEHGLTAELFTKPTHPILRGLLSGKKVSNFDDLELENYIFNDSYDINENHSIIGKTANIKQWLKEIYDYEADALTLEKTQIFNPQSNDISSFASAFNGLEFQIIDISKIQIPPERYYSKFAAELKKINNSLARKNKKDIEEI
ncbi:MAG1360 family OppF-related protein [Mycoplasmopsis opalescens]|uniref:MAG1360 family OppF-related protein n=1 Tax=Mycoplasmopsis opalescens TaxID=114886 RepID=UPI0004A7255A|nr:hypothetical protein [Mycoplasmopsis opalescens]